ncbi:MAG: LytTR family DNA-binding domain-containing protein [Dysgonamonadaceae bacterium]|nr:LytTR family DNA-binding domain-containing protein [Dysgonamonadaceae bacterium]MDD4728762.1 LytTR family DNA-binding domain-containing protein [Dysgonamonadaceae bacterium]
MELTCWIIDDEPLAIELLESYVAKTSFLKLTGSYSSAIPAMQDATTQSVDIIFLDIQMPEISGMEFARFIDDKTRIIFTTAFSEYALEGYQVDALDYLLKPITYTNFLVAAKKALKWFELKKSAINKASSSGLRQEEEQMFVKADHKLIRILFKDILYIEGWKDYVKIHLKDKPHPILSLMSMKGLEETLPSTMFIRIHRSFIIQKNKIDSISKNRVIIADKELPIGESYKEEFNKVVDGGIE